jgi:hypothetical protein
LSWLAVIKKINGKIAGREINPSEVNDIFRMCTRKAGNTCVHEASTGADDQVDSENLDILVLMLRASQV